MEICSLTETYGHFDDLRLRVFRFKFNSYNYGKNVLFFNRLLNIIYLSLISMDTVFLNVKTV